MLAEHIGVHVELVDRVVLREARTQTRGVEDRTGADDAGFRQAGALAEGVGQNIDRVADDQVDGVGRVARDLRDDALDDVDVRLRKVESRLARLSRDAGGNDDDVGILAVRIAARIDRARAAERRALANVERFAERLVVVDVDHDDFGSQTHDGQRVADGCTDAAASDDGDFIHTLIHPYLSSVSVRTVFPRVFLFIIEDFAL